MGKIIEFVQEEELDIWELDREQVLNCIEEVQQRIEELDEREPEDMDSEEYEIWGEEHEDLEDLLDELRERLETLER